MDAPILHIFIDEDDIPRTIHRRVKVKMIVQRHLRAGEPLDAIAAHYDISLADAHAALTYYDDHQAEMDAAIAHAEAVGQQVGVSNEELKAKVQQRLDRGRG